MKFKHVVASLFLSLAASAGLVAGLSSGSDAKIAKAEHAIDIGESGTIFLQLNTNDWRYTGSKIALYMFNNTENKNSWGNFATPSASSRFIEYSYSLDFTPEGCIAFRFDPGVETLGDWVFENDRGNSAIWSTTNDIAFSDVVWLGNYYPSSKWTESGSYALDAVVKGGATDDWSEATVDTRLTHVKVNNDDNLEVFGSVTLPAGTYFKTIKAGAWCGAYEAHSSIASNFSGGGDSNIHNVEAGTYEFYFDYDGEKTWITTPALAAADEFGVSFLSKTSGYCDASISDEVQAELKGEYDALASIEGAQAAFYGAEVKRGKGLDYDCKASEALSRYVNMQEQKGYGDFLGLGTINNPALPSSAYHSLFADGANNTMIIVITIAAVSALAFTLLLVFKKKKQK